MPKALFHLSSSSSSIQSVENNFDKTHLCKVKSISSLISIGTERLVAKGLVPFELYTEMNVPYMDGSFSFPIKYGYSLVGVVLEGDKSWIGKRVHLLHPHQDECFVSPNDIFEIPENIPSKRATLASNLETALNAVWDANIQIGDRVIVAGFGMVGAMVSILIQMIPSTEVFILEKNKKRKEIAQRLGFQLFNNDKVDVGFNTTSNSEGLQTCIDSIGKEGKIIELSWYGNQETIIRLGGSFHSQRKQIISSQVSNINSDKISRWDFARRKKVVFTLLENPIFDELIQEEIAFLDLPGFFQKIRNESLDQIGYVVNYEDTFS